jgi:hypothetical protein
MCVLIFHHSTGRLRTGSIGFFPSNYVEIIEKRST